MVSTPWAPPGRRTAAAREALASTPGAGSTSSCAVSPTTTGGYDSCSSTTPMRVCSAHTDAVGNQCNGIGCGYQATSPSVYFGGCSGNNTAGTLCGPP